jgi:selenophosphate synthase
LQRLVSEFGRVCERSKLSVTVTKSKVIRVTRREDVCDNEITLNGTRMDEVD